ncbi:hypothetical protein [Ruegeria marina]|uniref:Uncharacterized protein n=1 Tax=Ruegeria marina TaxID=639004 RepID=A0A1G6ZT41_9RHOB|nr:hypothetical protein [Ruegeria marina]SDE04985.1 hypothetical protein SAMN04488239_11370 [Ruegeria marina]
MAHLDHRTGIVVQVSSRHVAGLFRGLGRRLLGGFRVNFRSAPGVEHLSARLRRDAGLDEQGAKWEAARKAPLIRG